MTSIHFKMCTLYVYTVSFLNKQALFEIIRCKQFNFTKEKEKRLKTFTPPNNIC